MADYRDVLAAGAAQQAEQQRGMQRRAVNWATDTPAPMDIRSDTEKEWDATRERTKGWAPMLGGLYSQLTGDQAGAQESYASAKRHDERAAQLDSNVSTDYRDIDSVGGAFDYARKLAISSAPDMALSMGLGGAGRGLARRAAANAERRAVVARVSADMAEDGATSPLAQRALEIAEQRTARAATEGVAAKQRAEAVQRAAGEAVARMPSAQARIDRAGRAGGFAGATAGQFPGMTMESREHLEKTDQEGAWKIAAADLAAAGVGALPTERLLGRVLKTPAAKEGLAKQLAMAVPRIAKETGQQALFEGTTEAAQAFVQRAGHKWVDDNVALLSPEAVQDYVANFVGGVVLGGATGGAVETANQTAGVTSSAFREARPLARTGLDKASEGGRWAWDQSGSVRESVRDYLLNKSPFFQRAADAVAGEPGSPRREAMGDLAERAADAARGATEAGKRFADHLRGRERLDSVEDAADGVMGQLDRAMQADVEGGKPLGETVAHLPTFTQKWAMSHFDPDYLATKSPQAITSMGQVLGDLAAGKELSPDRRRLLFNLTQDPNTGLTLDALNTIGAVGPRVEAQIKRMEMKAEGRPRGERQQVRAEKTQGIAPLSETAGYQAPELKPDRTFSQDVAGAARMSDEIGANDNTESAQVDALNLQGDTTQTEDRAERAGRSNQFEAMLSRRAELASKLLPGRPTAPAPGMTNRETFQRWKDEKPEREELQQLTADLREHTLGQKTTSHPEGAFTFRQNNSEAGKQRWAEAEASPEYVTTDQTYTWTPDRAGKAPEERKLAVHLPSAITAYLARNSATLPTQPKARGQAALAGVISDLQASGVNIDADTLVPGPIYLPANGRRSEPEYVTTITPEFIAQLKEGRTNSAAAGAARVRQRVESGDAADTRSEQQAKRQYAQNKTVSAKRAEFRRLVSAEIKKVPGLGEQLSALRAQYRAVGNDASLSETQRAVEREKLTRQHSELVADASRRAAKNLTPSDYAQGRIEAAIAEGHFTQAELEANRRAANREATSPDGRRDDDESYQERDHRLVPRETPRGTVTRGDNRAYTPSLEVVADVRDGNRHAGLISRMAQNLVGSGMREFQLAQAYAKWRGNKHNAERNALFSALQDNGRDYFTHQALKRVLAAAEAANDLAQATNTKQRNAAVKAFRAKVEEVEYARSHERAMKMMEKTGKGLQDGFDAFLASRSGLRAAGVVERMGRQIAAARADGNMAEVARLSERLKKAQQRTPQIRTALRFASAFSAHARTTQAAIETYAAEEAAKAAAGKQATGVPLTKEQAKKELSAARSKLREFERDKGAMERVSAYEQAVSELEDRTKGTGRVAAYTMHDIAVAVAEAELKARRTDGSVTPEQYAKELAAVRKTDSGAAEQYMAQALNAGPIISHSKEDSNATAFNYEGEEGTGVAEALRASIRESLARRTERPIRAKESGLDQAIVDELDTLSSMDTKQKLTTGERRFLADVGMLVDGIPAGQREGSRIAEAYDAWVDSRHESRHERGRPEMQDRAAAAVDRGVIGKLYDDKPDPSKVPEARRRELAAKLEAEWASPRRGWSTTEESAAAANEGRKPDYGKATPLNPALRPATRERLDTAEGAPEPRKRKQVIKSIPQAQAAVDATENAGVASATAKTGPHDLKAEKEMLNEVLAQMGVPKLLSLKPLSKTDAKGAPRSPNTGGAYMLRTVQINDTLHGAERVEVLLHETGHHIYAAELAKAMGVEQQAVINMTDAQLLDALEKHLPAVAAEYSAWMAERGNAATVPLFQSSAPTYRQRGLATRNGGGAKVTRSTSIHEWMADNIARALAGRRETQSAVGKFFKAIADELRTFYDTMIGKSPRLAPAPSVEAWVDSLFNQNTNAVRQATGQAATKAQAEAVVEAAVRSEVAPDPTVPLPKAKMQAANAKKKKAPKAAEPPSPPAPPAAKKAKPGKPPKDFEGMMQYVRDFLPPQERKILEATFSGVRGKLRNIYAKRPDVLEAMTHAEHGMEATIAAGYLAWKAGKFKVGPKGDSALVSISDILHEIVGLAGTGSYAHRVLKDIASGKVQAMKEHGHTYDIVKAEARARGKLQQAVNKLGDVKEAVMRPVDRAFVGVGQQMRESGIPAMRKIGALLYRHGGATGEDRGMVREITHTTAQFANKAAEALNGLSVGQQRRVIRLLQEQATPEQINAKVSKRVGNKRNANHGNYRYSKEVREATKAIRVMMDEAFKYMEGAGVEVGYRKNFFPVLLDIRNDQARAQLTQLLSDPAYEQDIRGFFEKKSKPKDAGEPKAKMSTEAMIENLVNGAMRGENAAPGPDAPEFHSQNFQLMEFIYRRRNEALASGDAAAIAHHEANVKLFASLQTSSPVEAFARYIEPMVRRTEYVRRFGNKGEKLGAMLADMKKQGATDDQVRHAREAVQAAAGTYGQDLSPTINALSPALAERLSGRKSRAFISGMQAYQNARLLPLSLLSSLVDPMGIAVRSGGDFATAWSGIRGGLRAVFNKASRDELHDMLRLLGSAEDMGSMEALQQGFGGAGNVTAAKVNEFLFKWNGLAAWTRSTRYMALLSAHAFLIKHAEGATKGKTTTMPGQPDAESPRQRSSRYLAELNVKPGDVQLENVTLPGGRERQQVKLLTADERAKLAKSKDAADKEKLAADDRVRRALMQFVDEAILRPNSQQTPQWHSDPYMGLVTQYKAFGYAMYDQIMGRVNVELENQNHKVLLAAGAYVPIVIMAEMLRNVAQGDSDDTDDWGPDDWLKLGAERSGFLSPKFSLVEGAVDDVRHGRGPIASQMGPTASQARDVGKAAFGARGLGNTFESALPGSALYKKWNDEPRRHAE